MESPAEQAARRIWQRLEELRGEEYPKEPPTKWLEVVVDEIDEHSHRMLQAYGYYDDTGPPDESS